jgi:hypothetical protein
MCCGMANATFGAVQRLVGGWLGASLAPGQETAMVLLAASPRFFADSMNNP